MTKLQRSRIATWVKALRSEKYKQAKTALRSEDGYCCLGVACDVYRKETKKGKWSRDNYFVLKDAKSNLVLPPTVMVWFGIKDPDGEYAEGKYLTTLNDDGVPFKKIADIIESNIENLGVNLGE